MTEFLHFLFYVVAILLAIGLILGTGWLWNTMESSGWKTTDEVKLVKEGPFQEYYIDKNGNKWSSWYGKQEAVRLSRRMRNCYNCENCEDCVDCRECVNCTRCKNCYQCHCISDREDEACTNHTEFLTSDF